MVIVIVVPAQCIVFLSNFTLKLRNQIIQVVLLLIQVWILLSQSGNFIIFLIFDILNLAVFILKKSDKFIIFTNYAFFTLLNNFKFLVVGFRQQLSFFYFFFPCFILKISNFLLKGKLIWN